MINLLIALSHQSNLAGDLAKEMAGSPENKTESMDFSAFLEQPVSPLIEGQTTLTEAGIPAAGEEILIGSDRETDEHLRQEDPTAQVDVGVTDHDPDLTGDVVAPVHTDAPSLGSSRFEPDTDSRENKQTEGQSVVHSRNDELPIKGAPIVELKLQSATAEKTAQDHAGAIVRTDAEQTKPHPVKVVHSSVAPPVQAAPDVRMRPLSPSVPVEMARPIGGQGEISGDKRPVSRVLPVRLVDANVDPIVKGYTSLPAVPVLSDVAGTVSDAPVVAPMVAVEGETFPLQRAVGVMAPQPASPPSVPEQIVAVVLQKTDSVTELVLTPKELGRIQMVVNSVETGLVLHISSERPETLDLVRRHIAELAHDLKAAGYETVEFEFSGERSMSGGKEPFVPEVLELEAPTEEQYSGVFDTPGGLLRIGAMAGLDMRV